MFFESTLAQTTVCLFVCLFVFSLLCHRTTLDDTNTLGTDDWWAETRHEVYAL